MFRHFSSGFIENMEVSSLFFILDILLIVVFLPLTLNFIEQRKWAPMRAEIVSALAEARLASIRVFSHFVCQCFDVYIENRKVCNPTKSIPLVSNISGEISKITEDVRHYIDFLSPAIEPGMAGPTLEIIRHNQAIIQLLDSLHPFLEPLLLRTGMAIPLVPDSYAFIEHRPHHEAHYSIYQLYSALIASRVALGLLITEASLSRATKSRLRGGLESYAEAEERLHVAIDMVFDIMFLHPNGASKIQPAESVAAAALWPELNLAAAVFLNESDFAETYAKDRHFSEFVDRERYEINLCISLLPQGRRSELPLTS